MKGSKLLDSSVWIDYLSNGRHSDIIDSDEILLASALSLFEIKKKMMKLKIEPGKIDGSLEFIKKRSLILDVTSDIAEKATGFSLENELPMVDALIYTTSVLNNSILITLDNDFRGLKNVLIV